MIDCSKCIHNEVCANKVVNDGLDGECGFFQEEHPAGDLISRKALKRFLIEHKEDYLGDYQSGIDDCLVAIDNAPTVEPICPYLSDNEVKQPCIESPCERPKGELVSNKDKKLDYITLKVKEALLNFLDIEPYELMDLVVSLHNELYKEVKGKYYDYAFHWANLGYGGYPNDSLFKEDKKDGKGGAE